MHFSTKCTIFVALMLIGKNSVLRTSEAFLSNAFKNDLISQNISVLRKKNHLRQARCHVLVLALLVKSTSLENNLLKYHIFPNFFFLFSFMCIALPFAARITCRKKQHMLQRRPLLLYISLGAGSTRNIVRQMILRIASSILQAQGGSQCLDKPFKVCPEPVLGHLRVQEKNFCYISNYCCTSAILSSTQRFS